MCCVHYTVTLFFLNSYILAGPRGQIKGDEYYRYPDMEMLLRLVVRKKFIWPAIKRETTDFFRSNSASGIPEFNMAACFATSTSTTSAAIEGRWVRSILRCQARVLSDVIRVMQQDTLRWPQASLQSIYSQLDHPTSSMKNILLQTTSWWYKHRHAYGRLLACQKHSSGKLCNYIGMFRRTSAPW